MYDELTFLLDFMLARQGMFHQVGNQWKFDREADAATYNASFSRYRAIADKQLELREKVIERARANADRFRFAAETGFYDEGELVPLADESNDMRIDLLPDGCSINGQFLSFPVSIIKMSELLGQPSRVVEKINTIRVWDDAGIYTYSKPGSQEVDSIDIALNRQNEYDFTPRNTFSGVIRLGTCEIRDIDTPRSLNRQLRDFAFTSLDPWGFSWNVDFSAYSILMTIDKGGMCDTLAIQGSSAKDEVRPQTRDAGSFS
jgi:hypothetical protein